MKKRLLTVAAIIPLALFVLAAYFVVSSPREPAFGAPNRDAVIAHLNHLFTMAAYAITWAIQLGYLVWLGFKWVEEKRDGARGGRVMR